MGIKNLLSNAGKIFKPVSKATGKVLAKMDKNKPEILLITGLGLMIGGTIAAVVETMKVRDIMEESDEEMAKIEAEHEGLVMDMNGEPVAPISDEEYKKRMLRLRLDTAWELTKLFASSAIMEVGGVLCIVNGHKILNKRFIIAATGWKGTQEILDYVKKNVIADQGEEKWKEYRYGKVDDEPVELTIKDNNGDVTKKMTSVTRVKDHDNPWRIEYCEDLFRSWKPDTESNLFFLQGAEKYWNEEEYQRDKKAEYSMYQILDWLGAKWENFPKEYRVWLRANGWGHDIYGDDAISFNLQMPLNDPARRRLSDKIFIEFNADGILGDLINRYYEGKIGGATYQEKNVAHKAFKR